MAEGYQDNPYAIQDLTSNITITNARGTWRFLSVYIIGRVAYVQFGFTPSQSDLKNTFVASGFPNPERQPIHIEPQYYAVELIARDNYGKLYPMYISGNGSLANRNVALTSGLNIYATVSYVIA